MNKDAWIIYSKFIIDKKEKNGEKDELIKYAKDNFDLNIDIISSHDFYVTSDVTGNKLYYKGNLITEFPKLVIFRKYDIYLARQLELLGVKVLNSSQSMIDARNKMKTYQMLAQKNIKIPKTIYVVHGVSRKYFTFSEVCKLFNSNKFIVKHVFGSQGKDVFLIDNETDFNNLVKKYKGICIFQEYIESSFGRDIRCYVIGGKYIAGAVRQSNGNDFRSNLAQGGHPVKFEYNESVAKIAEAAAKTLNLDICGVDVLFGKNKDYVVCEVNSMCGFKSLNGTTNLRGNIVLLELIKDKLSKE